MHDHLVEFYETEALLVESVRDFAAPALRAGDPVLLVATPAHSAAFIHALEARGLNIQLAREQGLLIVLDAVETLDKISVDSFPDSARFDSVIGGLVASTGRPPHKLRIYGEMVALLWDGGNKLAALHLERLWNDLSDTHSFALLCSYPLAGLDWGPGSRGFDGICSAHSSVRMRFDAPQPDPASRPAESEFSRLHGLGTDLTAIKDVIRNATQMGRLAENKKSVSRSGLSNLDFDLTP